MPITFGQAKARLAQWAGKGGSSVTDPALNSFVREVLEYMLISGQYGNTRKFVFSAVKGVVTLPYELETPLKVKMGRSIGRVWDKWFEFYGYSDFEDCVEANAILEEPNYYPIVYDVPAGGAHIGTLGIDNEAEDAHIIVKGVDLTGRQIVTYHNGEQVVGEYLSIRKGQIMQSSVKFARIDEVVKTKTKGYVQLLWINPETTERGFLADYSPTEELPLYRRIRLKIRCADVTEVSILGRIRLKEYYADNDLIPFDNLYSLSLAAQSINADENRDPQTAALKDQRLQTLIQRENESKQPKNIGQPIEMQLSMSGGSIRNSIPRWFRGYGYGWGNWRR